jgi:cytochrome P450
LARTEDGELFGMADDIDLQRLNPRSHLAFGYGIHNCQGALLARMEMAATFRAFADRVGTMRVDESPGGLVYAESILHLALAKLPLRVTPAF